jgi:hypothetical protein
MRVECYLIDMDYKDFQRLEFREILQYGRDIKILLSSILLPKIVMIPVFRLLSNTQFVEWRF